MPRKPTGRPTGVRLTKHQTETTREKIRAAHLINKLHSHIDGKTDLSTTQVRSIDILMRKCLPDLADIKYDMTGNNVSFNLNLADPDKLLDTDD